MSDKVLGNYILIGVLFLLYVSFKLSFYYTKSVDKAKIISWLSTNCISTCFFGYQIMNNISTFGLGNTGFIMVISVGILSGLVLIFMKAGDR